MTQSPLLEFRSTNFLITAGEDDQTNPGIFGRSLATWIAHRLNSRGYETTPIIAEDFGWCVPVIKQPHRLYVACFSADADPQSWRVFVFAEGGLFSRLFGKDKRAESVTALFQSLRELLKDSPEVEDLQESNG